MILSKSWSSVDFINSSATFSWWMVKLDWRMLTFYCTYEIYKVMRKPSNFRVNSITRSGGESKVSFYYLKLKNYL